MEQTKFLSETMKVKCRICQMELLEKNYKHHLKTVHPKEDSKDLSRISDMFKRPRNIYYWLRHFNAGFSLVDMLWGNCGELMFGSLLL